MRSRKSIIYDQVINDQHDYFFSGDLYKLACDNGLTSYSSWPTYHLPMGDSAANPTISPNQFSEALIMSDIIYGMHNEDDEETLTGNEINKRVPVLLKKLFDIIGGNMIDKTLDTKHLDSNLGELINLKDDIKFDYGYGDKLAKFLSEIRLIARSLDVVDKVELKSMIWDFGIVFNGTEGLGMQCHVFVKKNEI